MTTKKSSTSAARPMMTRERRLEMYRRQDDYRREQTGRLMLVVLDALQEFDAQYRTDMENPDPKLLARLSRECAVAANQLRQMATVRRRRLQVVRDDPPPPPASSPRRAG